MTSMWTMHSLLVVALLTATVAIQRPRATRLELGIILVWSLLWIGRWCRSALATQGLTRQTTTTVPSRVGKRWHQGTVPLYLGSGFAWTTHHVSKLLEYLRQYGAFPDGIEMRGGTPLLHGVGSFSARTIHLSMGDLSTHLSVQGATQTGKSSLFRLLGRQIIPRCDGPVVLIDPRPELLLVRGIHRCSRTRGPSGCPD